MRLDMRDYFKVYEMPIQLGGGGSGGGAPVSGDYLKTGEMRVTGRTDVDTNVYEEVLETNNKLMDKVTDPELWDGLKNDNDDARYEFAGSAGGQSYSGTYYTGTNNYYYTRPRKWKDKWIRIRHRVGTAWQGANGYYIGFQVCPTPDFSSATRRSYYVSNAEFTNNASYRGVYFLPSVNKIIQIYYGNSSEKIVVFDIDDADDLNNYADSGLGQAPTYIQFNTTDDVHGITFDRDPSDPNCLVMINIEASSGSFVTRYNNSHVYIHPLNDIENIITNGVKHTYIQLRDALGVGYLSANQSTSKSTKSFPVIANGRIYGHGYAQDRIASCNYDDLSDGVIHLDFDSENYPSNDIDRIYLKSINGNVYVSALNHGMYVRMIGDDGFKYCNINPTVVKENLTPIHAIPQKNFILVQLKTKTGLNANYDIYASFDNGDTWKPFFDQGTNSSGTVDIDSQTEVSYENLREDSSYGYHNGDDLSLIVDVGPYTDAEWSYLSQKAHLMDFIPTTSSPKFEFAGSAGGQHSPRSNLNYLGTTYSNGTVGGIHVWKGKFIRLVYSSSFVYDSTNSMAIHVSTTADFATYNEYILPLWAARYAYNFTFIPEVNKILASSAIGDNIKIFDIDDADDFNNYNHVDFGGLGNTIPEITPASGKKFYGISIDRDQSDPSCLIMVNEVGNTSTSQYNGSLYIHLLNDLNNIKTSGTIVSTTDIVSAIGASPQSGLYVSYYSYPVISNGKIYYHETNNDRIHSLDYTNLSSNSIELDYSSLGLSNTDSDRIFMSSVAGNLYVRALGDSMDVKMLGDVSWRHCDINPNVSNEDVIPHYAIPSKNFIMVQLVTNTGLDPLNLYYASFDNGETWNPMFSQGTRDATTTSQFILNVSSTNLRNNSSSGTKGEMNELVVVAHKSIYSEAEWSYLDDEAHVMDFIPSGLSDTFTINPLKINDQVKGYLKK